MVGPGEVDEDLESETAEECARFGPVIRCRIYEEKNPMVPPEKAVRIFVQFATLDGAIKGTSNFILDFVLTLTSVRLPVQPSVASMDGSLRSARSRPSSLTRNVGSVAIWPAIPMSTEEGAFLDQP